MVLSWRASSEEELSRAAFDGTGDMYTIFSTHENVIAQDNTCENKAFEELVSLDGEAFEFFYPRFSINGKITTEGADIKTVREALIEHFNSQHEQKEVFEKELVALIKLMVSIDPDSFHFP